MFKDLFALLIQAVKLDPNIYKALIALLDSLVPPDNTRNMHPVYPVGKIERYRHFQGGVQKQRLFYGQEIISDFQGYAT